MKTVILSNPISQQSSKINISQSTWSYIENMNSDAENFLDSLIDKFIDKYSSSININKICFDFKVSEDSSTSIIFSIEKLEILRMVEPKTSRSEIKGQIKITNLKLEIKTEGKISLVLSIPEVVEIDVDLCLDTPKITSNVLIDSILSGLTSIQLKELIEIYKYINNFFEERSHMQLKESHNNDSVIEQNVEQNQENVNNPNIEYSLASSIDDDSEDLNSSNNTNNQFETSNIKSSLSKYSVIKPSNFNFHFNISSLNIYLVPIEDIKNEIQFDINTLNSPYSLKLNYETLEMKNIKTSIIFEPSIIYKTSISTLIIKEIYYLPDQVRNYYEQQIEKNIGEIDSINSIFTIPLISLDFKKDIPLLLYSIIDDNKKLELNWNLLTIHTALEFSSLLKILISDIKQILDNSIEPNIVPNIEKNDLYDFDENINDDSQITIAGNILCLIYLKRNGHLLYNSIPIFRKEKFIISSENILFKHIFNSTPSNNIKNYSIEFETFSFYFETEFTNLVDCQKFKPLLLIKSNDSGNSENIIPQAISIQIKDSPQNICSTSNPNSLYDSQEIISFKKVSNYDEPFSKLISINVDSNVPLTMQNKELKEFTTKVLSQSKVSILIRIHFLQLKIKKGQSDLIQEILSQIPSEEFKSELVKSEMSAISIDFYAEHALIDLKYENQEPLLEKNYNFIVKGLGLFYNPSYQNLVHNFLLLQIDSFTLSDQNSSRKILSYIPNFKYKSDPLNNVSMLNLILDGHSSTNTLLIEFERLCVDYMLDDVWIDDLTNFFVSPKVESKTKSHYDVFVVLKQFSFIITTKKPKLNFHFSKFSVSSNFDLPSDPYLNNCKKYKIECRDTNLFILDFNSCIKSNPRENIIITSSKEYFLELGYSYLGNIETIFGTLIKNTSEYPHVKYDLEALGDLQMSSDQFKVLLEIPSNLPKQNEDLEDFEKMKTQPKEEENLIMVVIPEEIIEKNRSWYLGDEPKSAIWLETPNLIEEYVPVQENNNQEVDFVFNFNFRKLKLKLLVGTSFSDQTPTIPINPQFLQFAFYNFKFEFKQGFDSEFKLNIEKFDAINKLNPMKINEFLKQNMEFRSSNNFQFVLKNFYNPKNRESSLNHLPSHYSTVDIVLVPILVYLDKDSINFLQTFFLSQKSIPNDFDDNKAKIQNQPSFIYFKKFHISHIYLNVNFISSFSDIEQIKINLSGITCENLLGWNEIYSSVRSIWLPQIQGLIPNIVSSLPVIRLLVSIIGFGTNIFQLTYEDYSNGTSSLSKVYTNFYSPVIRVTNEVLNLGSWVMSSTFKTFRYLESFLIKNPQLDITEEPKDFVEGTKKAYQEIHRHLKNTGNHIIIIPLEIYKNGGSIPGLLLDITKSIPLMIIGPLTSITSASSIILRGAVNSQSRINQNQNSLIKEEIEKK